jgi:hypothetical protein
MTFSAEGGLSFLPFIREWRKNKIQTLAPFAPSRFKNTCKSTARCAQDSKHAKKDTKTNGQQAEGVICLQGITFFMIIRPDQEKTKYKPWRPSRLSGSRWKNL